MQKMLSQNADVTAFAKVPATCAGVQNSADMARQADALHIEREGF